MKILRKRKIDPIATVTCSRRFENGVEIMEKEMHQVLKIGAHASAPIEARLVIGDAISLATKLFIAKTRSEIGGLDALLSTLTRPA